MRLAETSFASGKVRLRLLAAPGAEPEVDETTDPERIPYWSVLWPTVAPFAAWLLEQGGWSGTPVLELGCGAGLAGLALAAAGAALTQTDLFPEAAQLARENAVRNDLCRVHQVAADWRHWPLQHRWPAVVGCDLTYERSSHVPLLAVLEQSLAPSGTVWLSDPGRPMTLDFLGLAERAGWSVEIEALPTRSPEATALLYTLRRRGRGAATRP